MNEPVPYASAIVSLLDRESQGVKKATCYPITLVELQEFNGDSVKTVRAFIVGGDGKWVEVQ